ncbi:metalloproteinase [Colletotrichum orchidophilum]|uniref:Metalloproteinase n=1 Tax=Colletotrichum orchidophilum TaxID=1209926 RepID=A0A1G4B245_9PEZI|nr:metalloproteinase [Colletotrichum orchidophilum]OHE95461.1 metalloproteinase [Colletotrichum orchidophilum]
MPVASHSHPSSFFSVMQLTTGLRPEKGSLQGVSKVALTGERVYIHAAFHESLNAKRVIIQSHCTGTKKTAANVGTRLQQYFKSTSSSTKTTVAGVFGYATALLGSTSSGAGRISTSCGAVVYPSCTSQLALGSVPAPTTRSRSKTSFSEKSIWAV